MGDVRRPMSVLSTTDSVRHVTPGKLDGLSECCRRIPTPELCRLLDGVGSVRVFQLSRRGFFQIQKLLETYTLPDHHLRYAPLGGE
jgi:hypothetical protein